ncbi:TPA: proteasome accessory factor PafA2 [Candidatus Poribacteria bacterium]|nr:proteasome accessory factor PafA2 [Candidatus Poribacteria bacterium]
MSIPKIMGIETEYSISVRNATEQDPVSASNLVVNSYKERDFKEIIWDYEQENPLMDARGFQSDGDKETEEQKNSVINDILVNGGRYYVDHAHPEYCTPECTNARDIVIYEKAGELILDVSRMAAEEALPAGQEILIHKNNSDRKGHSYGCHENYLMDRQTPFENIVDGLMPFLVTRQIFTGSGKVGVENDGEPTEYQISQRADFFEAEVGLSTMVDRPIINTRDEPHADETLYRRLHVIVGDANMSEYAEYLKAGTTALILQLIEDDIVNTQFKLQEPVKALKDVSRDLSCKKKLKLNDGRELSAVEIQQEYLELAVKHFSILDISPVTKDILHKWEFVLAKLKEDSMQLDQQLDWVIKRHLIEAYRARHNLDWNHPKIAMLDIQYHDIRPSKGLYYRLLKNGKIERIVEQQEIIHAMSNPPTDTRAYFRGRCLRKFAKDIYSVNWNSMTFHIEKTTNGSSILLDRVPMNHPQRGTKAIVGELLDKCDTAAELVKAFNEASKSENS